MQDWIPSSSKSMPSLRDFVQSDINEFVSKSKLDTGSIAKSHLGDLAFLCLFAGRDFHWLPVEADSFEPLLRIGSLLIQNSKGLSMWHPLIATITVETCGIQLRQGIFNTLLEMLSRLSNLMRPSELNSLILHLLCHRDERQQFSKLVSWYLNEEDCSLPDLYEEMKINDISQFWRDGEQNAFVSAMHVLISRMYRQRKLMTKAIHEATLAEQLNSTWANRNNLALCQLREISTLKVGSDSMWQLVRQGNSNLSSNDKCKKAVKKALIRQTVNGDPIRTECAKRWRFTDADFESFIEKKKFLIVDTDLAEALRMLGPKSKDPLAVSFGLEDDTCHVNE